MHGATTKIIKQLVFLARVFKELGHSAMISTSYGRREWIGDYVWDT